jgi:hypothetical protein
VEKWRENVTSRRQAPPHIAWSEARGGGFFNYPEPVEILKQAFVSLLTPFSISLTCIVYVLRYFLDIFLKTVIETGAVTKDYLIYLTLPFLITLLYCDFELVNIRWKWTSHETLYYIMLKNYSVLIDFDNTFYAKSYLYKSVLAPYLLALAFGLYLSFSLSTISFEFFFSLTTQFVLFCLYVEKMYNLESNLVTVNKVQH